MKKELESLKNYLATIESTLKSKENDIKEQLNSIKTLEEQLKNFKNENKNLKDLISKNSEKIKSLEFELATAGSEEIALLTDSLSKKEKIIESQTLEIESLTKDIAKKDFLLENAKIEYNKQLEIKNSSFLNNASLVNDLKDAKVFIT